MVMVKEAARGPEISYDLSRKTIEVPYFVFEETSEVGVQNALAPYTQIYREGLPFKEASIDRQINKNTWEATITYEGVASGSSGEEEANNLPGITFDTIGGTNHITHSFGTVKTYGAASKKLNGAIGWDGEKVAGVDIIEPILNYSETHILSDSVVTSSYIKTIFKNTGKINKTSFRGMGPKEVLFIGASGNKINSDEWEIVYQFQYQSTKSNFKIGKFTIAEKKGWEYLWVQYEKVEDPDVSKIVPDAVAVYIEEVYLDVDFSFLSIGTEDII